MIELNYAEQWVDPESALAALEKYGNRLVPGLVECLDDEDEEVRLCAVTLLNAAGRRAGVGMPALIRLVVDPDRQVRVATAHAIQKFGPKAAAALPALEGWLADHHEYVRLVAVITILRIDPWRRRSLVPLIREAAESENPVVSGTATEFLAAEAD